VDPHGIARTERGYILTNLALLDLF
jgi:hypothetical protein